MVAAAVITEAVIAEVAVGAVVADSFLGAVAGETLFAGLGEAALGGVLGETFLGEFLGAVGGELAGTAAEIVGPVTAESLGASGTLAQSELVAAATKEAGIATQAADFAGVAGSGAEAVQPAAVPAAATTEVAAPTATEASVAETLAPQAQPAPAQSGVPDTGSGASASETTNAERNFVSEAKAGSKGGIVDDFMDWARDPKNRGLIQIGSSIAQVAGGAGQALLGESAQEKRIAAEKEMAQNKTYWDLTGAQQAAAQSGAWQQKLGFKPRVDANGQPITPALTRPGGQPVYKVPGIITGAMPR
jgi:hypothetical protein